MYVTHCNITFVNFYYFSFTFCLEIERIYIFHFQEFVFIFCLESTFYFVINPAIAKIFEICLKLLWPCYYYFLNSGKLRTFFTFTVIISFPFWKLFSIFHSNEILLLEISTTFFFLSWQFLFVASRSLFSNCKQLFYFFLTAFTASSKTSKYSKT